MSRFYRDLAAPKLSRAARKLLLGACNAGVPNRAVVRAGYCPGCKNELERCTCDEARDELDFEREAPCD